MEQNILHLNSYFRNIFLHWNLLMHFQNLILLDIFLVEHTLSRFTCVIILILIKIIKLNFYLLIQYIIQAVIYIWSVHLIFCNLSQMSNYQIKIWIITYVCLDAIHQKYLILFYPGSANAFNEHVRWHMWFL